MSARRYAPLLLAAVAVLVVACVARNPTDGLTAVPIADFKAVAGDWHGSVSGISAEHDDWVEVTVTPDGKFDFGSYRIIGLFGGTGSFTLSDGKLQMRGDRGSATIALYEGGTQRILEAKATLSDGRQLTAYLTPKR